MSQHKHSSTPQNTRVSFHPPLSLSTLFPNVSIGICLVVCLQLQVVIRLPSHSFQTPMLNPSHSLDVLQVQLIPSIWERTMRLANRKRPILPRGWPAMPYGAVSIVRSGGGEHQAYRILGTDATALPTTFDSIGCYLFSSPRLLINCCPFLGQNNGNG